MKMEPTIDTLFFARFDQKKGNIISWLRRASDRGHDPEQVSTSAQASNGLEFKVLPSGLHTVQRDLIYFIHDGLAGLSAFENAPAASAERNASLFSVGVLVPRDGSRLGKVWQHAEGLRQLAARLRSERILGSGTDSMSPSPKATRLLDNFFEAHQGPSAGNDDSHHENGEPTTRKGRRRGRSESTNLSTMDNHPAQSLLPLLDACGPLLFPLLRATLLRKRLLLISKPPLHKTCDFVYLISILSSLSEDVSDYLPHIPKVLEPLFTIGTYDIPTLESRNTGGTAGKAGTRPSGWIACTSDELLATKTELYDLKLDFSRQGTSSDPSTTWPTLSTSGGRTLRATQRDLRRYKALRQKVYNVTHGLGGDLPLDDAEENPLLTRMSSTDVQWTVPDESYVAEPWPWTAVAYDSFVWWASAGEAKSQQDERDTDLYLLELCFNGRPQSPLDSRPSMSDHGESSATEPLEVSFVTYFQQLTTSTLGAMSDYLPDSDDRSQSAEDDEMELTLSRSDLTMMGLDWSSEADQDFVRDTCSAYFDTKVRFRGPVVYCCGVRIV